MEISEQDRLSILQPEVGTVTAVAAVVVAVVAAVLCTFLEAMPVRMQLGRPARYFPSASSVRWLQGPLLVRSIYLDLN